ncbi:MAG: c-type cytochrome [Gammaproteobacteria bacterium]
MSDKKIVMGLGLACLILVASAEAHTDKPHVKKKAEPVESAAHSGHSRHRHASWVEAPEHYAGKHYSAWSDPAAAKRGAEIYQAQCASCHGLSGTGDGPAGAALAHKPADLTNHFHMGPGQGDAYLYWRVSEGGQAEPFRSQQSAMPPFKTTLSEQQRWDVLTHVHQAFHGGFKGASSHQGHAEHH